MKVKRFLENINKMVKENPSILDMEAVVTDEDGVACKVITTTPTIGFFYSREQSFYEPCDYEEITLKDVEDNALLIS